MQLDARLAEILEGIVDTYDAQPPDQRHRLMHHASFGGGNMHGWSDDKPRVTQDDLDELAGYVLIDIDYGGTNTYKVKPTQHGREAIYSARREQRREAQAAPVDLSWPVVRPVLHAAVDIWTERGASLSGSVPLGAVAERLGRDVDEIALIRAAEYLGAEDWLDVWYPTEGDEPALRPTMRAVIATRQWPGGDGEAAAERLLAALDEIEAKSLDEGKRKWAARTREALLDFGTQALVEIAAKSIGTAV